MEDIKIAPWAPEPPRPAISTSIARMNEQRGSFRDLTEQELEDDIARGADNAEAGSSDDDDDPATQRREQLFKAKEQILQNLWQANTEVATARDFVSLLMSERRPQAAVSLSQVTKEHAGTGTLAYKELVRPPNYLSQRRDQDEVRGEAEREKLLATGIKLRSLTSSAESLLAAAKRLEGEMQREARHWEDLVKIKSHGWIVNRIPAGKDRGTLGVRINALESAAVYRERGMVKIGRDEDGAAELDVAGELGTGKKVRVEIRSQEKIVAASKEDAVDTAMKEGVDGAETRGSDHLHATLRRARDSLFDEELFHELSRESTALWNKGVKWTDYGIAIPLERDADIVVSLAAPGDAVDLPDPDSSPSASFYQQIVDSMAPILRILLSHGFRRIHNRRTAPPRPLTAQKPSREVHQILHPLLNRTRHQIVQRSVNEFLQKVLSILKNAGFDTTLESPQDDMGLGEIISASAASSRPLVEAIVEQLSNPAMATYNLRIQAGAPLLRIQFVPRPEFKFELQDVPADSAIKKAPQSMYFLNQQEFEEAILHLVQLRVVEFLYGKLDKEQWLLDSPQTGEIHTRAPKQSEGGDLNIRVQMIRMSLTRDKLHVVWKKPETTGATSERNWQVKVEGGETGKHDLPAEMARIGAGTKAEA